MADPHRTVRAYHQETKHSTRGYAPSPGFLDWDSQPDPFRRFTGAPTVPLPLVSGADAADYQSLYNPRVGTQAPQDLAALALFFELALGLSAWKVAGPDRWALRNNPSSGNLHPTEGYLLLWHARDDAPPPGLYHYAPRDHLLERRAILPPAVVADLTAACPGIFGALGFSSIIWREAWKYGARAFRYCQLDMGHALASARYAAAALGWHLHLDSGIGDTTLAALLGLDRAGDNAEAEPEEPDALCLMGTATPGAPLPWARIAAALEDWRGTATRASPERVTWPQIARVLPALRKPETPAQSWTPPEQASAPNPVAWPSISANPISAPALIRARRSAQRMDGITTIDRTPFERALARTLPGTGAPFDMLPFPPALNLLIFVHGVNGLDPGLYMLIRAPQRVETFRQACTQAELAWAPVADTALPLYRLDAPADYRKLASQVSCYQGIAGRGAFSLGMIGAMGDSLTADGPWAYRRLHWEAGMIGQVLYLEAEASGLRGTGIGCFFDDSVHQLLGLDTSADAPWQTLYHFTVGGAREDTRLTTEPAYAHLRDRAWG